MIFIMVKFNNGPQWLSRVNLVTTVIVYLRNCLEIIVIIHKHFSVKSEAVHIYVYVLSLNLTYQREVGVIGVTVTHF